MIAKLISFLRIIAGPVCLLLIASNDQASLQAALLIMIAATVFGYLNSFLFIGNNSNNSTNPIIHTVSDSIYHISIFLAFLQNSWMPLWMVFLIYSRDIIVPYLQSFAIQRGIHIPDAILSTKLKSMLHGVCQIGVVAIALKLVELDGVSNSALIFALMIIAAGASLISLLNYLFLVISGAQQTQKA